MVVKLEDFLRRRTRLSLVLPHESLASSTGLREACRILFGEAAEEKWMEYFQTPFYHEPSEPKKASIVPLTRTKTDTQTQP